MVLKKMFASIIAMIKLQIFISLVSLPILITWGIPISVLTILGNILFGPFLTLFLSISSLVFFTELLTIPNAFLIQWLEFVTRSWLTIMNSIEKPLMIGLKKPPHCILLIIMIIILIIPLIRSLRLQWYTYFFFTIVVITSGCHWNTPQKCSIFTLPCNRGLVTLIQNNNRITLIDPGYIGQKASASSWIQYTLLPSLLRETGIYSIDYFIALQPNYFTLQALKTLCTIIDVRHIVLPINIPPLHTHYKTRQALQNLQTLALLKNTAILSLNEKKIELPIGNSNTLFCFPLGKIIKTGTVSYPSYAVLAQIDNKEFTIYSAKHSGSHA